MAPKKIPHQPDKFIQYEKVTGLIECNFFEFLNDKQAAMVMFYNPECHGCKESRSHYIRAAKTTKVEGHGYAAVDCTQEIELCKREGVSRMPTFQMYVEGQFVSRRDYPMDYIRMKDFIDQSLTVKAIKKPPPVDPPCPKKK